MMTPDLLSAACFAKITGHMRAKTLCFPARIMGHLIPEFRPEGEPIGVKVARGGVTFGLRLKEKGVDRGCFKFLVPDEHYIPFADWVKDPANGTIPSQIVLVGGPADCDDMQSEFAASLAATVE